MFAGIRVFSFGQHAFNTLDNAVLGSLHFASYNVDNEFEETAFVPGVAIEYRKNIDSLSSRFNLCLGASVETVPLKYIRENGYYQQMHFNFTIPLGLYYQIAETYFLGLYTSIDIPFANSYKNEFSGVFLKGSEFDFRFLNVNFSAGINLLKTYLVGDRQIIVEFNFKALGLIGLKSNDYWHYPAGSIPCYSGISLGYGF